MSVEDTSGVSASTSQIAGEFVESGLSPVAVSPACLSLRRHVG